MVDLKLYGNNEIEVERSGNTAKFFKNNIALEYGIRKYRYITIKVRKRFSMLEWNFHLEK